MKIKETLSYDDVLLVPQYSDIRSRTKNVDLKSNLDPNLQLNLPLIASPMDSISESSMAIAMNNAGGFAIIHRYNTLEEQINILKLFPKNQKIKAFAIGVTGDFLERAEQLINNGANLICLDIAHGHHTLMKEAIEKLKNKFSNTHLMAGNVATGEGYNDLASWGADSIRVGIGAGSICSTRTQTGFGIPMITSLDDCYQIKKYRSLEGLNIPIIIADGGIKNSGDCVKALAVGADFIIVGSLIAGSLETPGKVYTENGFTYKIYRGMASFEAQQNNRSGHMSMSPEGIAARVPYTGRSVIDIMKEVEGGIRSGLSYAGAINIEELRDNAVFIKQTSAGQLESSTHILRK
jgi:IMP dehydrogenase